MNKKLRNLNDELNNFIAFFNKFSLNELKEVSYILLGVSDENDEYIKAWISMILFSLGVPLKYKGYDYIFMSIESLLKMKQEEAINVSLKTIYQALDEKCEVTYAAFLISMNNTLQNILIKEHEEAYEEIFGKEFISKERINLLVFICSVTEYIRNKFIIKKAKNDSYTPIRDIFEYFAIMNYSSEELEHISKKNIEISIKAYNGLKELLEYLEEKKYSKNELKTMLGLLEKQMVQEDNNQIQKRIINNVLNEFGIPMEILGYKYLTTALELLLKMKHEEAITIKMGNIYQEVATIHNNNYNNVRQAINSCIKISMANGKEDGSFHNVLGKTFRTGGKPSASEFLKSMSEYIRYQFYEEKIKKAKKQTENLEHLRLKIIVYEVLKDIGVPTFKLGTLYLRELVTILILKEQSNINSFYHIMGKKYNCSNAQVLNEIKEVFIMTIKHNKDNESLKNIIEIKEKTPISLKEFIQSIVKYIKNEYL